MADISAQINDKLGRLSTEDFDFAIKFIALITVPEFWAEFVALTPEGEAAPPLEVARELVYKWELKGGLQHGAETAVN